MASGGNKLGDAYVELSTRIEALEKGLADARAKTEKETKAMGEAAERNVGGGFSKVGEAINKSTEGVRKFAGSITSSVGVATGLLGVFASISAVVVLIKKGWDGIIENLKESAQLSEGLTKSLEDGAAAVQKQREITAGEVRLQEQIAELEAIRSDSVLRNNPYKIAAALKLNAAETENKTTQELLLLLIDQIAKKEQQLGDLRDRKGKEYKQQLKDEADAKEATANSTQRQADAERERLRLLTQFQALLEGDFAPDEFAENIDRLRKEAGRAEDEARDERWRKRREQILEESRIRFEGMRDLWDEENRRADELKEKLGGLYDKAIASQSAGLGNLSGTIETLAARMEAAIEASSFSSSRRQS